MTRPEALAAGRPHTSRIWATVRALIRTRVSTGLLIVLPIWLTWLLVTFIFNVMSNASRWVVDLVLRSRTVERWLNALGFEWRALESLAELPVLWQRGISIFSVLLTVFLLYTIGLLAANIVGRRVIDLYERVLDRVPLVKTVYRGSKQILSTITGTEKNSFQRVALIPFLTPQVRSVGFLTNVFTDARTGEELCTVFYATTPNPTTGFILILKRRDVIELDWTIEEAVKTIVSGGIVLPPGLSLVQPSTDPGPTRLEPADAPAQPPRLADG